MSIILERPRSAPSRPAERARSAAPAHDGDRAAVVQHALSTTHALTLEHVSAASDLFGLHGAGGDLVDLIPSEGQLVAVLGDVSGKGAPASLIAAVVLASVQHHVALLGPQPGAVLAAVCASVSAMLDRTGSIVTLAIAAIDPATDALRIASAGHHPIALAAEGGTTNVVPTCPPLGALPACSSETVIDFSRGATLVIASDGFTEQPDQRGNEFGLAGLTSLAERARTDSPAAAIERAVALVETHADGASAVDDRAIIVVTSGGAR